MDRAEASRISHGELRLWNPLSERALDEAIELLDLAPGAGVLDVACGRAEVLRRVAERWDVRGSGYDSDPALIESGPPGLDLQVRDSPPPGPFDLAICIASSHALGGFPDALGALRELTAPGGQVLLGEGYWQRPPSSEYLEALGGASADELPDYPRLMRAAEEAGLTPLYASVAERGGLGPLRVAADPERRALGGRAPGRSGRRGPARARAPRAGAGDHARRA